MTIKIKADEVFRRLRFLFDPQKLVMFRGVPGSGKTTMAEILFNMCPPSVRMGRGIGHFENDQFFVKNGKYEWSRDRLMDAIDWCNYKVVTSLMEGMTVIVSNTFIKHGHVMGLVNFASALGIPTVVFRMTGNHKDIHNVPKEKVDAMRAAFQDYKYEIRTAGFDADGGLTLEIPEYMH